VRYHWSGIPTSIDRRPIDCRVAARSITPLELSLEELKRLAEPARDHRQSDQCSGNTRAFHARATRPALNGGHGQRAQWTAFALKRCWRSGRTGRAVPGEFSWLDRPPLVGSPGFVKALTIDHALDREVMLAWGDECEDLPMLNGFRCACIVPGHYGTYWIKHLSDIQVSTSVRGLLDEHRVRIPDNPCACVAAGNDPGQDGADRPLNVRSFHYRCCGRAQMPAGRETTVRGIAFDGGSASRRSRFRPTAEGRGVRRIWARIWAATPSANGRPHSRRPARELSS